MIFPGVYLNYSAKGISTTIGFKGLSVNLGSNGAFLNSGVPGTGFYSRQKLFNNTSQNVEQQTTDEPLYFLPSEIEGEIKSENASSVTSDGLMQMKEILVSAYEEKKAILIEIPKVEKDLKKAANLKILANICIIGLLTTKFKNKHVERKIYLEELQRQSIECSVGIDIEISEKLKSSFEELIEEFISLAHCCKIWDKISTVRKKDYRSLAQNTITRSLTYLEIQNIEFISSNFNCLYFKNCNGSDIYIYPAFAIFFDNQDNFGLVDLADLNLEFIEVPFLEEEGVPEDSQVISETWAKVNNNGTPDKRFKDNYRIPIVSYGEIHLKSSKGIDEVFMFSDTRKAESFVKRYQQYSEILKFTS